MPQKKKQKSWLKKTQYIATALIFMLGIADAIYLVFWYGKEPVSEKPRMEAFSLQLTDATGAVARVVDGVFEGDQLSVRTTHSAIGDLNGDGLADAAIVARVDKGDADGLQTLFLLLNTGQAMVNTDKKTISDRMEITALAIEDGTIKLGYLDREADEPSPSESRTMAFQLWGVRLEETYGDGK